MKNVNKQNVVSAWVPARVTDDIQNQIDSIASEMGVQRHEVVSAALKAGLSISPYELAMVKVMADRETSLN